MSVYIKGMEMPESCRDCSIEQKGFWCGALDGYQDTRCFANERRDDCPLVEVPDHGRLIDADALMEIIKSNAYMVRHGYNEIESGMTVYGIQQAINEVPTVIPADGGAE